MSKKLTLNEIFRRAAQLTLTNVLFFLAIEVDRAGNYSLPVPDSPRTRTVAVLSAT